MVYVTEDWNAFEGYAENCRVGTYQLKEAVEGWETRVRAGRMGYIHTFKQENDPTLTRILKFCHTHNFIRVEYTLQDEVFHT